MDSRTVEEPLLSQVKMSEYKERDYREYLVDQGITLAVVKFLLSLRNASKKPDSPSQALIDYFSSQKDQSWQEYDELEQTVYKLKEENEQYKIEVIELQQQIEQAKQDKLKKEEEERIRLEEESKKTSKKGAKK